MFTDHDVDRVARALAGVPGEAYTTPIVYPWSVQHFVSQPLTERPRPSADPQRLYLHIPFCLYHCSFCFYAVRTGAGREEMARYVSALQRELEWVPDGTPVSRLIVGGGTPTALPPDLFRRVLASVFDRLRRTTESSHTLEASPDSLTDDHLRALHDYQVGRVSIGIESLDESVLGAVQRRHTAEQALAACRAVTSSGLTLNVDLIYGLPGQTEDSFRRDLETVAATGADTLCLYGLRVNERTPVAGQLAAEERLDLARVMRWRSFVTRTAREAGYAQTRCYTFKRADGRPSWHEQAPAGRVNGMSTELGIGMAARSQLGSAVYRNHERIDVYMNRVEQGSSPVETVFELEAHDLKTQYIAGTLGNGRPLARAAFCASFGTSLDDEYRPVLERLIETGLVEDDGEQIALTETGTLVYDRILLCFYPVRSRDWLASRRSAWRTRVGRG